MEKLATDKYGYIAFICLLAGFCFVFFVFSLIAIPFIYIDSV